MELKDSLRYSYIRYHSLGGNPFNGIERELIEKVVEFDKEYLNPFNGIERALALCHLVEKLS